MSVAVFELGGDLAPEVPELAVGPWTHAGPRLAAFAAVTGPPGGPPESLWRVELARDLAASRAALAGGEHSVARTHAVLDAAPRRLDRALAALARGSQAPADDSATAPELPPVESALVAALSGTEAHALPMELTAWSAGESAPGGPGPLERALGRIAALARGRARIETRVEGVLAAHSVMTLSGDTDVWVAPRLSMAGVQLHARSVAVAVRTRHAWARILTLVLRSCSRLMMFGLPTAGVAALPTVWRFVRDLLREVRVLVAAPVPA